MERLGSPNAIEDFSPLTGSPLLVVDLGGGDMPPDEQIDRARATLVRLPCPSAALVAGQPLSPAAAKLVDAFDVVVASDAELAPIRATTRRTPLAAMALVQLLRQGASVTVEAGLIAESFAYATLQGGPEFAVWLAGRAPSPRGATRPEPPVLVRRTNDRLHVTLNRPDRCNAISRTMRDALVEALEIAVSDASVREVVLCGAGPAFSSGGDLDEFGMLPDPATAHAIRSTRNPARLLAACAERVRCEVHGACVGAGVELPAFARRVVAARGTSFQLPELSMGLIPGAGGTVSLPGRIGRQRTAQLALSGVRLDADTALRWGLIDEIGD